MRQRRRGGADERALLFPRPREHERVSRCVWRDGARASRPWPGRSGGWRWYGW